jgi:hypothetical protein
MRDAAVVVAVPGPGAATGGRGGGGGKPGAAGAAPCAACKLLRRRCAAGCVFAPYFPPGEPHKFASVHKVFGASNVSKLLQVWYVRTYRLQLHRPPTHTPCSTHPRNRR